MGSNRQIAIVSINENAYSESFIHAHLKYLDGRIRHYYGGSYPIYLDGSYINYSRARIRFERLKLRLQSVSLSHEELCLFISLRDTGAQLVLAEYGVVGAKILRVCRLMQLPLIVHFHGFDVSVRDVLEEYKDRYKALFSYSKYILAVSHTMVNELIKLGSEPGKIVYNPYGPNDSFFKLSGSKDNMVFVAVGRFVMKKAPHYTIFAFEQVVRKFSQAKLIFIGGGQDLFYTCKDIVDYLKLNGNVTFVGIADHGLIAQYLQTSMAFVQHSMVSPSGDSEGTPVAILEAGAAGLPVIATKHAGITEAVIDSETGFLVDEGDYEAMAQKMIYLCENMDRAIEMGQNARAHIRKNYSLDMHVSRINNLVEKTING